MLIAVDKLVIRLANNVKDGRLSRIAIFLNQLILAVAVDARVGLNIFKR